MAHVHRVSSFRQSCRDARFIIDTSQVEPEDGFIHGHSGSDVTAANGREQQSPHDTFATYGSSPDRWAGLHDCDQRRRW